jgi:hypothetical protein
MKNPHVHPEDDPQASPEDTIESYTSDQLARYIAFYSWNQAHGVNSSGQKYGKQYESAAYYAYRTNQRIYEASKILNSRGLIVDRGLARLINKPSKN